MGEPLSPLDLEPIAVTVNVGIESLRKGLNPKPTEPDRNQTQYPPDNQLAQVLKGIIYNGGSTNAKAVRDAIFPFYDSYEQRTEQGVGVKNKYLALFKDLAIIRLLERGGLEEVNEILTQLLEIAQNPVATQRARVRAAEEMGVYLTRAIGLFPHLAKGVEVSFQGAVVDSYEQTKKQFELGREGGMFIEYDRVIQQIARPSASILQLPLPFGYQDEHHRFQKESYDHLVRNCAVAHIDSFHPRAVRDGVEPVLRVCLSSALADNAHPPFSLNSLAYLRFMDDVGHFTPLISPEYPPQMGTQGQMRENYISNYLLFKKFGQDRWEQTLNAVEVTHTGIIRRLRSFVAITFGAKTPEQIELMEFEAGKSPGYDEVRRLVDPKTRTGLDYPGATSYFGNDVIRRLMHTI